MDYILLSSVELLWPGVKVLLEWRLEHHELGLKKKKRSKIEHENVIEILLIENV